MTVVVHALSVAVLLMLSAMIALKSLEPVWRLRRRSGWPRWYIACKWLVPSSRLFGQEGPSFDMYAIVGDSKGDADEHFHGMLGGRKRWFHCLFNPYSRFRLLVRQNLQIVLYQQSSGEDLPHARVATRALERVALDELRRRHPGDVHGRTYALYSIVDRGFWSHHPPEAHLRLGPFES